MAEAVDKEVCSVKHGELNRRAEVQDKRLNSHSADITDLKIIVGQLTQLLETTTKALETMEKRVSTLETAHEDSNGFWSSPGGQWIIKGSVTIAVVLTLAAIGQNVNPEFLASIFGK
ncbi:hypothetical protein [Desulfosporosinus sp.]|uniref:hypothetical protein n=1 Tax=Desulfosporosinus sp. TaxID=157907 RepID=UPI0025BBC455|nr:hypothetical protein [Desulfosporosinus sp.]MBC2723320.1 hypothetical protein [Desulfosporosinus sp.]MBC2726242.1 hypothetical protein [Desulfosporosinus sp.]